MKVPSLEKEMALLIQGFCFIAGIDEAGRGAWAGPVVAAAVILPLSNPDLATDLTGVRDSKKMTKQQRDKLYVTIQAVALSIGIGIGSHTHIDQHRIVAATRHAMSQAVARLDRPPDYLLIDALSLPDVNIPQDAFPKADDLSLSVAAASIIAKVTRDRLMVQMDHYYPGYHFGRHKGYGTAAHQTALSALGPCTLHRYSFAPIQRYLITQSATKASKSSEA